MVSCGSVPEQVARGLGRQKADEAVIRLLTCESIPFLHHLCLWVIPSASRANCLLGALTAMSCQSHLITKLFCAETRSLWSRTAAVFICGLQTEVTAG